MCKERGGVGGGGEERGAHLLSIVSATTYHNIFHEEIQK